MWSEASQVFSLQLLAQISLLSDVKEYKKPELCVADRKVARVIEEWSYRQLREVYVSLADSTSYFNCPCSYRQHGKQTLTKKGSLADGLGQCALSRRGSMEGDTEAPVCLWRRRQEIRTDWNTHGHYDVSSKCGLPVKGTDLVSDDIIRNYWLYLEYVVMWSETFHMLILQISIYLQEACEIKASLGRENIFSIWSLNTALQKGNIPQPKVFFYYPGWLSLMYARIAYLRIQA